MVLEHCRSVGGGVVLEHCRYCRAVSGRVCGFGALCRSVGGCVVLSTV